MHHDVGDYMLDIVRNSLEADAKTVVLSFEQARDRWLLAVLDDGCGMTGDELAKAQDPFWSRPDKHPSRRAGLGLPFFAMAAEASGGAFAIRTQRGRGTLVRGFFDPRHPDCPPVLGLPFALALTVCMSGDHELIVRRMWTDDEGRRDGYRVRRSELLEASGGLESAACLALVRSFFESQEYLYGKTELERSAKT